MNIEVEGYGTHMEIFFLPYSVEAVVMGLIMMIREYVCGVETPPSRIRIDDLITRKT
jgi:hypothetical protein